MSLSASLLRKKLKYYFDLTISTREPLEIERRYGEDIVVLPKSDFQALEETAYLLSSPANAKRLLEALQRNPEKRNIITDIDQLQHAIYA
jgi:antitoxin YefM